MASFSSATYPARMDSSDRDDSSYERWLEGVRFFGERLGSERKV